MTSSPRIRHTCFSHWFSPIWAIDLNSTGDTGYFVDNIVVFFTKTAFRVQFVSQLQQISLMNCVRIDFENTGLPWKATIWRRIQTIWYVRFGLWLIFTVKGKPVALCVIRALAMHIDAMVITILKCSTALIQYWKISNCSYYVTIEYLVFPWIQPYNFDAAL